MRRRPCLICLAAVLALMVPTVRAGDDGLFAHASVAPDDATLYIHIRDGRWLRKQLARRPIGRWLESLLAAGPAREAWHRLATGAGMPPERLFDECLGRRFTVVCRAGDAGPMQWALLTEADEATIKRLYARLEPKLGPPGTRVVELPEQGLLLADYRGHLAVGSMDVPALFHEVTERVAGRGGRSLAGHPAVAEGRRLGAGHAAVLFRHAPPMGGWSVVVAGLEGERVNLRHAGDFDVSPLQRPVTRTRCDFSPIVAVEPRTMVAMIEPTDVGDGMLMPFLEVAFGEPLLNRELRRSLGPRRMVMLDEAEGRALDEPVDLLTTSVAICLDVRDDEAALAKLDSQMTRLAARLNTHAQGAFLVEIPTLPDHDGPRRIDISPATSYLTGGFPIMRNIELNWTVVSGMHGTWFVIASHEPHLNEIAEALRDAEPEGRLWGRYDSVGTADGMRLGRHLASWSEQAHLFAGPEYVEDFRATTRLLSEFCTGIKRCHWRLARPADDRMRLDVQLFLTPPESAAGP